MPQACNTLWNSYRSRLISRAHSHLAWDRCFQVPRVKKIGHSIGLTADRIAVVLVALALFLGLCPGSGTSAEESQETPKADSATLPATPGASEATGFQATSLARTAYEVIIVQYWSLGPLLRAEAVMSGHNIVTVVNGDYYYVYDSLTNSGYRIRRAAEVVAADANRKRPFGMQLEEILSFGGEKIREETFEGVPVEVYRMTNDEERRTLWVQKNSDAIPIRIETYERKQARTARLDWINWLTGLKVSRSFFSPPSQVEFEEFDSYEAYLLRLAQGPVLPAPPFFHELIQVR